MANFIDIICAPATVPGTGAISVVRVSGEGCIPLADRVIKLRKGDLASSKGYTLHYGSITLGNGVLLDEVVVSLFRAPHSYTGEDSLEISCHASKYIVGEILRLLLELGCRMARPGEFTQRAFLAGKMDLAQAEAVADVIASTSEASHRVAISQMKGGFSAELAAMRAELLHLVTLMELELDFSEEEVEFADRSELRGLLDKTLSHIGSLMESFKLGNALRNGVPTAIVGATNAGKSTLLNALLGEDRAIVSPIDGTTRDTIEETLNIGGVLFRFIDTAGLRDAADTVEKIGIERSYKKLGEASIVLAMLDGGKSEEEIRESLQGILGRVNLAEQKLIVLLNKVDGLSGEEVRNKIVTLQNIIVSYAGCSVVTCDSELSSEIGAGEPQNTSSKSEIHILAISAKTGKGIEELKKTLADSQKDLIEDAASQTLVTNLRHYEALRSAQGSLKSVEEGLSAGVPTDLLCQDIREAIDALGEIVGVISSQEVLNNVFANFCIGK